MPSSKAVLADIHKLGLDPSRPHYKIKASGHLAAPVLVVQVPVPVVKTKAVPVEEPVVSIVSEPVLMTMARLMDEVMEAPELVVQPESEVEALVEPVADPVVARAEEAEVVTPKKKLPKKAKKEASEDPAGSAS